ncbi:MAG: VOC family protein [Deltaproteobacteria bacterium]|nr:VOC family protein [Deltaproteobacteria bacterium]
MAKLDGYFVWYELMTTDPGAAEAFYGEVIGWQVEPFQGAPMPYALWKVDGTSVGGCMQLPPEAQEAGPHWIGFVQVDDIDASVAKAESLGGRCLVPAADIPEVGRFATLADPRGGTLSIFKPAKDEMSVPDPARDGDFSWHEHGTDELASAFDFYAGLFGWSVAEDMDMGPGGIYRLYQVGEHQLGGFYQRGPGMPDMGHGFLYYIKVGDLDAALARVEKHGGTKVAGPMPVPGGSRIGLCRDPQGAAFALTGK